MTPVGKTSNSIRIFVVCVSTWYILTTLYLTATLRRHDVVVRNSVRSDSNIDDTHLSRRLLNEESNFEHKYKKNTMAPPLQNNIKVASLNEKENRNDQKDEQSVLPALPKDTEAVQLPTANGKNTVKLNKVEELAQCDKIPLVDGRHFFRNRLRVVDKHLSDICGPKILIIGSMKCGTDRIADLLLKHPRIVVNSCNLSNTQGGCNQGLFQAALKQGLVFDGHDFTHVRRNRPDDWLNEFGRRLPLTDGVDTVTFDKSPSYMEVSIFPDVAKLAKKYLPNAKIVATTCNPAERLYSEFSHLIQSDLNGFHQFYHDNGVVPPNDFTSFVELLKDDNPICIEKSGFCESNRKQYLMKGEFLNNIRPWYEEYDQQDVLVVERNHHPSNTVNALLAHVGVDILPPDEYPWDELDSFPPAIDDGRSSAYDIFKNEMVWLDHYYSPHNDRLSKEIKKIWPKEWNSATT